MKIYKIINFCLKNNIVNNIIDFFEKYFFYKKNNYLQKYNNILYFLKYKEIYKVIEK